MVEKLQRRLASWRTHVLSMAGKATLIKSVNATIPSYTMQTMLFPKTVTTEIDKLNRDFLWGDTLEKKKFHLVNWNTMCKVKKHGGLGIKKAKDQNIALLSELGWKLVSNQERIWCEGMKWKIGDGETVDVWRDWWCDAKPLEDIVTSQNLNMPTELSGLHVKDLMREDGNWDETWANDVFPTPISNVILGQPFPNKSAKDLPLWKGALDGVFSILSVYELLIGTDEIEEDWNWLWKLRVPQKLKAFLWTMCHGKLLTNHMRMKRGLTTES
ncbi:hypothetical protein ACSBR2_029376 [Camellia fascicularis]